MTEDDLAIRRSNQADLYRIAVMHIESWRQCYAGMVPKEYLDELDPITWLQEYRRLIDGGRTILLAESECMALGIAIFGRSPSDTDRVEIDALYVAQGKQGDGIGRRLLQAVLDYQEYTIVSLECATSNRRGCKFWEASGFRFTGETGSISIPGAGDVPTKRYILGSNASS